MCHIEINGQSFQPSQNALKQILLIIGPGASIWRGRFLHLPMHLYHLALTSLKESKLHNHLFEQTWVHFIQECFGPSLFDKALQVVTGTKPALYPNCIYDTIYFYTWYQTVRSHIGLSLCAYVSGEDFLKSIGTLIIQYTFMTIISPLKRAWP